MTIQTKTIVIPKSTREGVASVTCDLCRQVFAKARFACGDIEWTGETYCGKTATTCVYTIDGFVSPETNSSRERHYHVCPKCFAEKLEPWLNAQGAIPTTKETES